MQAVVYIALKTSYMCAKVQTNSLCAHSFVHHSTVLHAGWSGGHSMLLRQSSVLDQMGRSTRDTFYQHIAQASDHLPINMHMHAWVDITDNTLAHNSYATTQHTPNTVCPLSAHVYIYIYRVCTASNALVIYMSLEGEGGVGGRPHPFGQELQHILALLSSLQGVPGEVGAPHTHQQRDQPTLAAIMKRVHSSLMAAKPGRLNSTLLRNTG